MLLRLGPTFHRVKLEPCKSLNNYKSAPKLLSMSAKAVLEILVNDKVD